LPPTTYGLEMETAYSGFRASQICHLLTSTLTSLLRAPHGAVIQYSHTIRQTLFTTAITHRQLHICTQLSHTPDTHSKTSANKMLLFKR